MTSCLKDCRPSQNKTMAPPNASFGALWVISWLVSCQKPEGLPNCNSHAHFQHSTELGAQLVALEQSYCRPVVSEPSKSLPVRQVQHLCGPHHKSIPSPAINGAKQSHYPCRVCQMCATCTVGLGQMKTREGKLANFATELTLFLHHTDMPFVAKQYL